MLNLLHIVSTHPLREVGELLRRASIKQRLSFIRKKIARRGNAKGILALSILFYFVCKYEEQWENFVFEKRRRLSLKARSS